MTSMAARPAEGKSPRRQSRQSGAASDRQRLPEVDESLRLHVAQGGVGLQADVILQQAIAGDLRIPARPRPVLRGLDQPGAPAGPAHVRIDVPALDVPDGRRLAAVRILSGPRLEESAESTVAAID